MQLTKEKLQETKARAEQERDQLIANINMRLGQIALLDQQLKDLDAPEAAAAEEPTPPVNRARNGKMSHA